MIDSLANLSLATLLERLASKEPVPGGGAVAPLIGAFSAGLAQMVVAYSIGKKSLAEHEEELREASVRLERARVALLDLADADAGAYAVLNAAFKMDKADEQRGEKIAAGARAAVIPPQATMAMGVDLLRLYERLGAITNKQLASDLRIAAILGEACARASAENILVNLPMLGDAKRAAELRGECERSVGEAHARCRAVVHALS
ncbi:MAG: cyclodeaminase/cyclohydrolase family protein [Phycisphaerales bacterium]|nr:cyclodeaminase/cyclohydrolase family protein [Phycisphaerales bacterium]